MAYRESDGGSTSTPDERRAEMDRLLDIIEDLDTEQCAPNEQKFIADMREHRDWRISEKQIFWMRSIKDGIL